MARGLFFEGPSKKGVFPTWKWECLGFKFVPGDMWVGLYWKFERGFLISTWDIYICVLPMLPLHLRLTARARLFFEETASEQTDTNNGG
jgi:hypothetical protein